MPVIVFIIDNSASMSQLTNMGISCLDLAKFSIENFLKIRSRDPLNARNDRYMLLTLDEIPTNIKVGWKESMATFTNELKNLKAFGLTNIGAVLKQAFDLLNLNRLSAGMETYGQGRCPFYLEPSLIILISDGSLLTNTNSVTDELLLSLTNSPLGCELTIEPFRWDQRLFSIIINMYSIPNQDHNFQTFIPNANQCPVNIMCEVTGGRSYLISSHRMLMQCLESLVSKIQAGVVLNLEKFGYETTGIKSDDITDRNLQWEKCRKMILVAKSTTKGYSIGHWPIPEDHWIDANTKSLPPRSAIPLIKFKCEPCEPLALEDIPFDRYELEPSPLTQYMLERRQPNIAWQVFVPNSLKANDLGLPFGYIKSSTNLMTVNLFVMPYNYPVLFQLINELLLTLKLKPTKSWNDKFDSYLKSIPPYYYSPLRRVLSKKGLQHLVPENLECYLSEQVQIYLKKIKNQAKLLFDQVCAYGGCYNQLIKISKNTFTEDNNEVDTLDQSITEIIKHQIHDLNNLNIIINDDKKTSLVPKKHIYSLKRHNLITALNRYRLIAFNVEKIDEKLNNVTIHEMGNYHEYLKSQTPPLRDIESKMVRQYMFGNPFKLVSKEQKAMFGTDEIDEILEESTENQHQQRAQLQQINKKNSLIRRRGLKGLLLKRISFSRSYSHGSLSMKNELDIDSEENFENICLSNNMSEEIISTEKKNEFENDQLVNNEIKCNYSCNYQETKCTNSQHFFNPDYKKYNILKKITFHQVRSNKSYDFMLNTLNENNFRNQIQDVLLKELIYEAKRFKRQNIISRLQNYKSK